MAQVQILRSDVAGYVPTTLLVGSMFYNIADGTLHIGTTGNQPQLVSDNAADTQSTLDSYSSRLTTLENQSQSSVSATEPTEANSGDLWFDTTLGNLKVYNGSDWVLASTAGEDLAAQGVYPVTASELFDHIIYTADSAEETQALATIAAASSFAESYTKRILIQQDVSFVFDYFPSSISGKKQPFKLFGGTVNSVSALSYYDTNGALQTVTDLRIVTRNGNSFLFPAIGQEWPTDCNAEESGIITINYNVGTTASRVPPAIRAAILLIAGSLWENRENEVMGQSIATLKPSIAAKDLLHPHKLR